MEGTSKLILAFLQCCGAENISFDSGPAEKQIFLLAPAPAPAPAPALNEFYRIPGQLLFDLSTTTFLHGLMHVVPR